MSDTMLTPIAFRAACAKIIPGRKSLELALSIWLPAILLSASVAYTLLKADVDLRKNKLQAQEAGEVRFAEQMLTQDFDSAISDLQLLLQTPAMKHYADTGNPVEKQRLTEQFANMMQTKQHYDQIRYLDLRGMEKIRVNLIENKAVLTPESELQNKADRYYFKEILKRSAEEIYVSPLDLNIEHEKIELPYKPIIRFGIPVFDRAGNKQGILLFNFRGQVLLDGFIKAMSDKQHAMLLNHDGYWLSHPKPALEWSHLLGGNETFGKYHPRVWKTISVLQRGSLHMPEGLYTFSTVHPLLMEQHEHWQDNKSVAHIHDDYFWKIVSFVPADEVPAITVSQYPRVFALLVAGMLLLAFLSLYIAHSLINRRQLRATIVENEARLKEITSTLGEGIFVVDNRQLTTFINPEAERLLGWTNTELLGKNAHDMFHQRNLDGTTLHIEDCEIYRVMKSGISHHSNAHTFWRKDGSAMQVDVSASPILRDGKITGSVVAFSDISMQKKAESALLKSETQLKQAQRLAQLGSWELYHANNELTWSDEIYRIFEIDPDTFGASYESFLNTIHPEDRERVNRVFGESIAQHKPYSTEHRLLLADGRIKHVLERGETLYDTDGSPLHSIGTVQDITERKIALVALQNSKETARALLNASTESAILMDRNCTVLALNTVAAQRLRKRPDELIGRDLFSLFPPEIIASRKAKLNEAISSRQPIQFQDERNGMHLHNSLYPILDAEGNVSQFAIYSSDITERIKLQAEETLLHHIDQHVLRSSSLTGLLQNVCDEIVQLFGYQFAWLGKKETDGAFSVAANAGSASAYNHELLRIGVRWDDSSQGRGPSGSCVRTGRIQIFKVSDSSFQPWRDAAAEAGFQSIIGIPLVVRGQVYGALTLYSAFEHEFDDSATVNRLSNIASRICVALETAMDHEQLRLLGTALASAGNGVFITDARGKILWINAAFTRLTGYSSDETLGRNPALLKSGKQDDAYYKMLWQTIQQGNTWSNETVERHKNGELFTVQQTITPIRNEEGVISHYVSILDDITAQKETAARIQYMAHYDALTALPNRALFHDRLHQTLLQAKREGKICALMFLDLDRFKAVNDTLGHHIGDLLLQAVADRLKDCVRETDTVSRLAGDEFTVILPFVNGRDDAARVAEKITAALAAPFMLNGHEVNIGSSTGIAFYPSDADADEALIKCADQAMYTAKEQGRGRFGFYKAD